MADCSPEARAERRQQIADLWKKIGSGVTSVSDRSRSVGYTSIDQMLKAVSELERQEAECDRGGKRASRLSYSPLVKAL